MDTEKSQKGKTRMLQTLNNLAGKISPTSGGGVGGVGGVTSAPPTTIMPDCTSAKLAQLNNNNRINNNNTLAANNNNNSSSINNNSPFVKQLEKAQDQPDPDYIKMFVGQVPRSMDEADLTKMFSEFGRIHQINVLRDKLSGQSRGCCFVTFYTRQAALAAQNALHNIKVLPGMHHPIQMKPADSENRNERKLFVGMMSKKYTESDVRQMFEGFGNIEECTVLRDTAGQSKGCAFVTFTSKQCAINAIKTMHHSKTMEGCALPLVVKFADTQKEKDQKRLHQMQANLWNLAGMSLSPQSYLNQHLLQLQANNSPSTLGTQLLLQNSTAAGLHNLASINGSNSSLNDISSANLHNLAALANLSAVNNNFAMTPISMQNLVTLAAMGANSVTPTAFPSLGSTAAGGPTLTALTNTLNGYAPTSLTIPEAYQQYSGGPTLTALTNTLNGYAPTSLTIPEAYQQYSAGYGSGSTSATSGVSAAGKQIEGPEGANLFIYHLPNEFTDQDLAATFHPFGNVISAKVFIDRQTKISKCFGFVSYDNPISAQGAIQSMNGFQIGNKRLKVQQKRPKEAARPY